MWYAHTHTHTHVLHWKKKKKKNKITIFINININGWYMWSKFLYNHHNNDLLCKVCVNYLQNHFIYVKHILCVCVSCIQPFFFYFKCLWKLLSCDNIFFGIFFFLPNLNMKMKCWLLFIAFFFFVVSIHSLFFFSFFFLWSLVGLHTLACGLLNLRGHYQHHHHHPYPYKQHYFTITYRKEGSKTFELKAETETKCNAWVHAIENAR